MLKLIPLVPRQPLNEQAYEALREFIMSGGLRSDRFASANQIAQVLGVSVTPVKEALRRLAEAGLVEILPQRGVRLVTFAPQDISEIYDLREGLELLALHLAPRPFPRPVLAEMEAIVAECEQYVALPDRARYTRADMRLHELLVDASRNRRLVRSFLDLQGQIQLVRLRAIVLPGRPHQSHVEHQEILAALRDDPDRADAAIRSHIRNVKNDVLRTATGGDGLSRADADTERTRRR